MLSPLSYGLEKALPVLIQRPENLLRDFARQGFVGVVRLHAPMHLMVVEIDALFDEGLSYLIVGSIIQVLGGKSRLIYNLIASVTLADNVLLNQLHVARPPIAGQSSRFCLSHGLGRTCGRRMSTRWPLNLPASLLYRSQTHERFPAACPGLARAFRWNAHRNG